MTARIAVVTATLVLLATAIAASAAVTAPPAAPVLAAPLRLSLVLAIQPKDLDAASDTMGGGWHENPYVIGIAVVLAVIIVVLASSGATRIIDKKP